MALTGCFAADLADAVTTAINAETWTQTFTAVRPKRWLVRHTAQELQTLAVTVVPALSTTDEANWTRAEDEWVQAVDVAVQEYIGQQGDCDPLGKLVEAIREFFLHWETELGTKAAECTGRQFVNGQNSLIAKEHLEDLNTFTAVLRLQFTVTDRG